MIVCKPLWITVFKLVNSLEFGHETSQESMYTAGSTLSTLFTVPFSKKRKRENEQQQTGGSQTGSKHKPFPAAHYTVTLEQMEANLYPLPSIDDNGNMTCPDGFAATQPAGK